MYQPSRHNSVVRLRYMSKLTILADFDNQSHHVPISLPTVLKC